MHAAQFLAIFYGVQVDSYLLPIVKQPPASHDTVIVFQLKFNNDSPEYGGYNLQHFEQKQQPGLYKQSIIKYN